MGKSKKLKHGGYKNYSMQRKVERFYEVLDTCKELHDVLKSKNLDMQGVPVYQSGIKFLAHDFSPSPEVAADADLKKFIQGRSKFVKDNSSDGKTLKDLLVRSSPEDIARGLATSAARGFYGVVPDGNKERLEVMNTRIDPEWYGKQVCDSLLTSVKNVGQSDKKSLGVMPRLRSFKPSLNAEGRLQSSIGALYGEEYTALLKPLVKGLLEQLGHINTQAKFVPFSSLITKSTANLYSQAGVSGVDVHYVTGLESALDKQWQAQLHVFGTEEDGKREVFKSVFNDMVGNDEYRKVLLYNTYDRYPQLRELLPLEVFDKKQEEQNKKSDTGKDKDIKINGKDQVNGGNSGGANLNDLQVA